MPNKAILSLSFWIHLSPPCSGLRSWPQNQQIWADKSRLVTITNTRHFWFPTIEELAFGKGISSSVPLSSTMFLTSVDMQATLRKRWQIELEPLKPNPVCPLDFVQEKTSASHGKYVYCTYMYNIIIYIYNPYSHIDTNIFNTFQHQHFPSLVFCFLPLFEWECVHRSGLASAPLAQPRRSRPGKISATLCHLPERFGMWKFMHWFWDVLGFILEMFHTNIYYIHWYHQMSSQPMALADALLSTECLQQLYI